MTPAEAIQTLRQHNKWRRGGGEDIEMLNPKTIGQAIDTACDSLEKSMQFVATMSTEIADLKDALAAMEALGIE